MKTKRVFGIMIAGLLSFTCMAQENEKRFAIELSGGPSIASSELKSGKLENGLGFEGILHYSLMSSTGIYAGWGWNRFTSDLSFAGNNTDFEETGYVFGLQYEHPINGSRSTYYLRAGGLYNHIEVENTNRGKSYRIQNMVWDFSWEPDLISRWATHGACRQI